MMPAASSWKSATLALSLVLCILDGTSALRWIRASDGDVPLNSVTYKHGAKYQFCRVVQDGRMYSGIHRVPEPDCTFIIDGAVAKAKQYEILVEDETEAPHDWKYNWEDATKVPESAVKCQHHGVSECYLGLSLYGDGVCDEGIGYIDFKEGMHTFPFFGKVSRCPLFMFLVEGGQKAKGRIQPQ